MTSLLAPTRSGALPRKVRRQLEAIVGPGHVRWTDGDVAPFSRDATPPFAARPDAVVFPATTAEVAAVLRVAQAHGVPVVPRGAGSNLCAGTVALRGGIVLVLTRMDAILEVSAEELLARAEPGVTTAALSAAAAEQGLLFAPDPGSKTVSTVGGNVATCAGGLRGLKYGGDPQLRAGTGGGAGHRGGDPDRRPAVEGRRRLRPDPAAHRLRGHPRGDHRGHAGPAMPTSGCVPRRARCCCSATTARRTWSRATSPGWSSCAPRPARSR